MACNFNPHDPAASTDPGCKDPASPTFYSTCKVLIDPITGQASGATIDPTVVCRSITCGDGHINMADGEDMYIFGFSDVTNVPEMDIVTRGNPQATDNPFYPIGSANFSAPTFFAHEGQALYLTLTNSGMRERPDLFDPHTVHYHGFPNAASVFDGEPMASLSIGLGESLTYFYDNKYAGTYMWHCHVEAAEHMQMGMLGNLYILPAQDAVCATAHAASGGMPASGPAFCFKDAAQTSKWSGFAFDDGDGSTGYDAMYFLQETAFDPDFHHADQTYQKIPFADMTDRYAMLNGRGYPDTVNPAVLVNQVNNNPSQPIPAIAMTVDATGARAPAIIHAGNRVLLAPVELVDGRLLHGHRARHPHAGRRTGRAAVARPDGDQHVVRDRVGHARRRRRRRRHARHHRRRARHLLPLHDEPQLPQQQRRRLRRNDDRDRRPVRRRAMHKTLVVQLGLAALLTTTLAACGSRTSGGVSGTVGGHGLIGGVGSDSPTPTFTLVAAPNVISTGDGDSMYMWLYGTGGANVQYPGPTLIVKQGAVVTITLTSQLPVATSIVFPGLDVTASGGAGTAQGLLTREVLPSTGGTVSYTFTASRPGTFLYHSGTRPDLQVEMGLSGAIIVRPSTFSAAATCTTGTAPCRKAYGDASTAYDREYLFFLTDADPLLHQAVAFASATEIAAGYPSIDTTTRHAGRLVHQRAQLPRHHHRLGRGVAADAAVQRLRAPAPRREGADAHGRRRLRSASVPHARAEPPRDRA